MGNIFGILSRLFWQSDSDKGMVFMKISDDHLTRRKKMYPELACIAVPHEKLKAVGELGSGYFGVTYRFKIASRDDDVAGKVLRGSEMDARALERFFEEAKTMSAFSHGNVISIAGFVWDLTPPIILMPLMKGNLKDALCRQTFQQVEMRKFCFQISRGMKYLASLNYIHRDLAARNCLLDSNNVVKISDFGLAHKLPWARQWDDSDIYYRGSGGVPLPVRWMPLEAIDPKTKIFTLKTDVWSFGVVMWEIYTGGQNPYGNLDNGSVQGFLSNGKRLHAPLAMPPEMQTIMNRCWAKDPGSRPTFSVIYNTIEEQLPFVSTVI